jgi:hypothetical protein
MKTIKMLNLIIWASISCQLFPSSASSNFLRGLESIHVASNITPFAPAPINPVTISSLLNTVKSMLGRRASSSQSHGAKIINPSAITSLSLRSSESPNESKKRKENIVNQSMSSSDILAIPRSTVSPQAILSPHSAEARSVLGGSIMSLPYESKERAEGKGNGNITFDFDSARGLPNLLQSPRDMSSPASILSPKETNKETFEVEEPDFMVLQQLPAPVWPSLNNQSFESGLNVVVTLCGTYKAVYKGHTCRYKQQIQDGSTWQGSAAHAVEWTDIRTGRALIKEYNSEMIHGFDFSPEGKFIALVTNEHVRIYNTATGKGIAKKRLNKGEVGKVSWGVNNHLAIDPFGLPGKFLAYDMKPLMNKFK